MHDMVHVEKEEGGEDETGQIRTTWRGERPPLQEELDLLFFGGGGRDLLPPLPPPYHTSALRTLCIVVVV